MRDEVRKAGVRIQEPGARMNKAENRFHRFSFLLDSDF
jgi:hypothetical protein